MTRTRVAAFMRDSSQLRLTDEFDEVLVKHCECTESESDGEGTCLDCGKPINQKAANSIVQRPNAVISNGGPQRLRGLMLPLPPSANRYWRSMPMVKKGTQFPIYLRSFKEIYQKIRAVTHPSDESRAYIQSIKEMAIQRGFMFNLDTPVRIDLVVCPRDKREIDAHNYSKVLLDALEQAQVIIDDSQAIDVRTRLGPIIKGGRVVVSMWEISSDPHAVLKEAWR